MRSFQEALDRYDYVLSKERIAQRPAHPRDSAKLLVYDRKTAEVRDMLFRNIGDFLPSRSVLVLNETKVIPAKLMAKRSTGGHVSLLYLKREGEYLLVLANRRLRPGEELRLSQEESLIVEGESGNAWLLKPSFRVSRIEDILESIGSAPLPPYIKRTPLSPEEVRQEYQSVFAKEPGSIAAPTASLHFTSALLDSLCAAGVRIARVTLHVHLGTFAPLSQRQWKEGKLHEEYYHMDEDVVKILEEAKKAHDPIIAVGTTVVRALESASDREGRIVRPSGTTDLFIREGYKFRLVEGLITNFHVPRSSLLMLVAAFMGEDELFSLYEHAIERQYRFFSFGDAMLIL